jgi:phosphatidate cytidylyltransferase
MPASDLFVPAAARLVLALAGGLGLIVVAERHHLKELTGRVLFLRWRTWAISAPLFGAAAAGPLPLAVLFVMALSFQGMREYGSLVGLTPRYRRALYAAGLLSAPVAIASLTAWRAMPPILLIAATLTPLLMQDVEEGVKRLALAGLGFAYIPWLLTYLLLIREHAPGGQGVLLAIGMAIALSDVCAFAIGKLFGKHPLAVRLSPNKTIEGLVGNFVGAYAGFAAMGFAWSGEVNSLVAWVLPTVIAIGCVWGDLVESLIKRQFDAKDAGSWLPGFGGLLDRIDSLLFALPLSYTVLVLWG